MSFCEMREIISERRGSEELRRSTECLEVPGVSWDVISSIMLSISCFLMMSEIESMTDCCYTPNILRVIESLGIVMLI